MVDSTSPIVRQDCALQSGVQLLIEGRECYEGSMNAARSRRRTKTDCARNRSWGHHPEAGFEDATNQKEAFPMCLIHSCRVRMHSACDPSNE